MYRLFVDEVYICRYMPNFFLQREGISLPDFAMIGRPFEPTTRGDVDVRATT